MAGWKKNKSGPYFSKKKLFRCRLSHLPSCALNRHRAYPAVDLTSLGAFLSYYPLLFLLGIPFNIAHSPFKGKSPFAPSQHLVDKILSLT
jgi:hypothetical protein